VSRENGCRLFSLSKNTAASPPDFFKQEAQNAPRSGSCANRVGLAAAGRECRESSGPEDEDRDQDQIEHLAIHDPEAEEQGRDTPQIVSTM